MTSTTPSPKSKATQAKGKPVVVSAATKRPTDDRTFHATAILAAQTAKATPKSAVLKTSAGFYTGSKRAGLKAGAEFVGRVVSVLAKPTVKTTKQPKS